MSIGLFAHLYVEIIQHECIMGWLKKKEVFIKYKSPIQDSFVTTFNVLPAPGQESSPVRL